MNSSEITLESLMQWLDEHINYERTGMGSGGEEHDPERRLRNLRTLMDIMDNPQDAFPSIHLTGTNGKTSTARMLTSLVMTQGLRVGTYTSPHLERLNERISVNGVPVDDYEMHELLLALMLLEPMLGEAKPSYFELLTAAAFRHFADAPAQVGVIEVGVGGKWDATNIIDAAVAVITNVGLDHQNYLGDTREEIAEHKAGIIKENATVVLAEPDEHLHKIFLERPHSRAYITGEHFAAENNRVAVGGRVVNLRTPATTYEDVFISLHGAHQAHNASTALMAAEAFFGQPLHEDVVREAFATVTSPGRLEVVSRRPLCVLDGAHNVGGINALTESLDQEFAVNGQRILVVGMLNPHEPAEILEALGASRARALIACQPDSPRAVPANEIASIAKEMHVPVVTIEEPAKAAREAVAMAGEDDLVVVTGSLYVVGEARHALRVT